MTATERKSRGARFRFDELLPRVPKCPARGLSSEVEEVLKDGERVAFLGRDVVITDSQYRREEVGGRWRKREGVTAR